MIIAVTHVLLPFMILPMLRRPTNHSRERPGRPNLGAGVPFTTSLKVTLPLSLPAVFAGTPIFILALGFYVTPALCSDPQTLMMAKLISVRQLPPTSRSALRVDVEMAP
nr:hypothetical protein [Sinorhizobium psoraleae]